MSESSRRAGLTNRAARGKREGLEIYLHDINETPLLSAVEERELALKVEAGDQVARQEMVKANLRLVVSIARGYIGKGLSLEDLIEEGNLGLLHAVQDFSSQQGTRFSTYASYWIKQSIKRAIGDTAKPIRLPAYMIELVAKWKQAHRALTIALGHEPTKAQIAFYLEVTKKKALMMLERGLQIAEAHHYDTTSDEGSVLDTLTNQDTRSPLEQAVQAEELAMVFNGMGKLKGRYRKVINLRFGLNGRPAMTLKEVGEEFHVGRERARQVESEALDSLRAKLPIQQDENPQELITPTPAKTKAKKAKAPSSDGPNPDVADMAIILSLKSREPTADQNQRRQRATNAAATRKRHAGRPRGVDPTTCRVVQSDGERQFAAAAQSATQHKGSPLEVSELLAIMASLNYQMSDALKQPGIDPAATVSAALDDYKKIGRKFPTWSEVFQVLLPYHTAPAKAAIPTSTPASSADPPE